MLKISDISINFSFFPNSFYRITTFQHEFGKNIYDVGDENIDYIFTHFALKWKIRQMKRSIWQPLEYNMPQFYISVYIGFQKMVFVDGSHYVNFFVENI